MAKTLEQVNEEALPKVTLAHRILKKIKTNPRLENIENISIIYSTLDCIKLIYNLDACSNILNDKSIPYAIKDFVKEANIYRYERKRYLEN